MGPNEKPPCVQDDKPNDYDRFPEAWLVKPFRLYPGGNMLMQAAERMLPDLSIPEGAGPKQGPFMLHEIPF